MTSPSFDALRPSPVTLSQELFSSQDGHTMSANEASSFQQLELLTALPNSTVNPASLSPTLTPVPEADEEDEPATSEASPADAAAISKVTSADTTQHPAVSVGGSTTFGMAGEVAAATASGADSHVAPDFSHLDLDSHFPLSAAAHPDSYVLESSFFASPDASDSEYNHTFSDEPFTFDDFITDDHVVHPSEQQPQHTAFGGVVNDASLFAPETQVS